MSAIRIPRSDVPDDGRTDDGVHRQAGLAPKAIDAASRRACPVCGSDLDPASVNVADGTARCRTKGHLVAVHRK